MRLRPWLAAVQFAVLPAMIGGMPQPAHAAAKVDRILVEKAARRLTLWAGLEKVKTYRVALGPSPVGDKTCQGDGRTPEGLYRISGRNPSSAYHRSLRISYPDATDRAAAKKLGCDPGGDIFLHGLPNGSSPVAPGAVLGDWTLGCIAVTSPEIDEIWALVVDGTRVEIRP